MPGLPLTRRDRGDLPEFATLGEGRMKLNRSIARHPASRTTTIDSTAMPMSRRIRHPTLALQGLLEFSLPAGAIHDLPFQLAAGGVDVVAAGAAHRHGLALALFNCFWNRADGLVAGTFSACRGTG